MISTAYNLLVSQLNFSRQQEKISPTMSTTCANPATHASSVSSNTSITWTPDLHEKFVECVNSLGGAESKSMRPFAFGVFCFYFYR